jgi:hypothetical protein
MYMYVDVWSWQIMYIPKFERQFPYCNIILSNFAISVLSVFDLAYPQDYCFSELALKIQLSVLV